MSRAWSVLALVLWLSGMEARAESILTGTVVEVTTGEPLPEVVVTATSPEHDGERIAVTDAQGVYRLSGLPAGRYTLRFDKEDFEQRTRRDLQLSGDETQRVDMWLIVEESPARIDLPFHGPMVIDVGSTETRWRSWDELESLVQRLALNPPTGAGGRMRSFDGLVGIVPGAQDALSGASLRGASPFENRYELDGLSSQDAVLGLNPLPLSAELLEDLEVITGGERAERGNSLGGLIQATTRSGTSTSHGSVFGTWAPGGRLTQADAGVTVGGPLLGNRLTFFAGVIPAFSRSDARVLQALAKVTYVHDGNHSLSLSLLTSPSRAGGDDLVGLGGQTTLAALRYQGDFLYKRLQTETHLGWSQQRAWLSSGALRRAQAHVQARWLPSRKSSLFIQGGVGADHSGADAFASTRMGGFLQASVPWSRVVLNVGGRYDVQAVAARADRAAFTPGAGVSPRVGLVVDPLANGRMAVFAHYAKYQGPLLLGLLATLPATGGIDPGLVAPTSHEFVAGANYELLPWTRLGVSASRHQLETDLAHVSREGGGTVFLGNPGRGLARELPEATRTQDAFTVQLDRPIFSASPGWLLRASYTWARVSGNDAGPFQLVETDGALALRPRVVSDEEETPTGPLPLDRTHTVRLLAAREFSLSSRWSVSLGGAYRGRSGVPLEVPGTARTPWTHDLDARLVVDWAREHSGRLSLSLEVFNVLDQRESREALPATGLTRASRTQAPRQARLGVRYAF